MSNQNLIKKSRSKKRLFFVVATAFGVYKVFSDLQTAVDYYVALYSSLSEGDSIKIGHYLWSDKDIESFNLFSDALFESSQNA